MFVQRPGYASCKFAGAEIGSGVIWCEEDMRILVSDMALNRWD